MLSRWFSHLRLQTVAIWRNNRVLSVLLVALAGGHWVVLLFCMASLLFRLCFFVAYIVSQALPLSRQPRTTWVRYLAAWQQTSAALGWWPSMCIVSFRPHRRRILNTYPALSHGFRHVHHGSLHIGPVEV